MRQNVVYQAFVPRPDPLRTRKATVIFRTFILAVPALFSKQLIVPVAGSQMCWCFMLRFIQWPAFLKKAVYLGRFS